MGKQLLLAVPIRHIRRADAITGTKDSPPAQYNQLDGRRVSQHLKVLTVCVLVVVLAEEPREHGLGLHARAHQALVAYPRRGRRRTAVGRLARIGQPLGNLPLELLLEANLREDADEQLVHVVIDHDGYLHELGTVRARQAFAICSTGQECLLNNESQQTAE